MVVKSTTKKAYQELLKGRLTILNQQEVEAKKGTIYRDSLGKIKSGDVLGGLEGLSLRQLKKLQTQLLSHLGFNRFRYQG